MKQAMESLAKEKWKAAIASEYSSLTEKKVFSKPCHLPPGFKTLDTKLVLKLKELEAGAVERRYKARLCVRGFTQEEGKDFEFTFAPVATYNVLADKYLADKLHLAAAEKYAD